MDSPALASKDHRDVLLKQEDIQRWYELPSGFKVGLRSSGEFRMGAEAGECLILNSSGEDWINLGSYRFYFPSWNAGGVQPENWNKPLCVSADGTYLALKWLYAHRHSTMSPVLIHLPTRTYSLVEPRRILTVMDVAIVNDDPLLSCSEIVWLNSQRRDLSDVKVGVSSEMQPIDEFFKLDPFDIDTDVYSWKEGVLFIEPLKSYPRTKPATDKEREEIKRDRKYSPVQRWQHVKDLMTWIGRQ
jgi:hypothetical protein